MSVPPNHALQRTRPSRSGCNPRVPRAGSLSLVVRPLMRVRSPFVRRWLLYGVLISFVHFFTVWFFGVIIDEGVITDRLTSFGSLLTFPGGWLQLTFSRDIFSALPSSLAPFYSRHEVFFYLVALFWNSALWGFTIAAGVVYGCRRFAGSHSQHENAA